MGGTFIRDPRVFVILPLLQKFFGINSLFRHLFCVSKRYEKTKQQTKNKKIKNENQEGHIPPICGKRLAIYPSFKHLKLMENYPVNLVDKRLLQK